MSGHSSPPTRRRVRVGRFGALSGWPRLRRAAGDGCLHHWRLGFRQSGFHHGARVARAPVIRTCWPRSLPHHAAVPRGFRRKVGWATQKSPSSKLLPAARGIDDQVKRRTRPAQVFWWRVRLRPKLCENRLHKSERTLYGRGHRSIWRDPVTSPSSSAAGVGWIPVAILFIARPAPVRKYQGTSRDCLLRVMVPGSVGGYASTARLKYPGGFFGAVAGFSATQYQRGISAAVY